MGDAAHFLLSVFWISLISIALWWAIWSLHRVLTGLVCGTSDATQWLGRARKGASIEIEEYGLRATEAGDPGEWSFRWDEVEEIETYKWDLWACDEICVAFRVSEGWYELSEESEQFDTVMKIVEERFPGVPDDWWSEVAFPALESNVRTLWKRDQEETTAPDSEES